MQRVTFGEAWWNAKKFELYSVVAEAKKAKQIEQDTKKAKLDAKKGKKNKVENRTVTMEIRVRERLGYFKYNFMPWLRAKYLDQIKVLDSIEAELDGEAELRGDA